MKKIICIVLALMVIACTVKSSTKEDVDDRPFELMKQTTHCKYWRIKGNFGSGTIGYACECDGLVHCSVAAR